VAPQALNSLTLTERRHSATANPPVTNYYYTVLLLSLRSRRCFLGETAEFSLHIDPSKRCGAVARERNSLEKKPFAAPHQAPQERHSCPAPWRFGRPTLILAPPAGRSSTRTRPHRRGRAGSGW
jgi:hypothetical protein